MYEHRCLENIKKLYKCDGTCDYQHEYQAIIEADMVLNPEGLTYNSPVDVVTSGNINNPSISKLLSQFSELFNVNQGTDIGRLVYVLKNQGRNYEQCFIV